LRFKDVLVLYANISSVSMYSPKHRLLIQYGHTVDWRILQLDRYLFSRWRNDYHAPTASSWAYCFSLHFRWRMFWLYRDPVCNLYEAWCLAVFFAFVIDGTLW